MRRENGSRRKTPPCKGGKIMKNDTIQSRNRITTCLLALLTFCLVLTGVFFIAPLEAEAVEEVYCPTHTDEAYVNGFCSQCSGEASYQEATLNTDAYDVNGDGESDDVYEIGNAGQLYWFADKVNNDWDNFKNANAVLTDDIVVNENVVVDGRLNSDEATVAEFRHWSAVGYLETNGYYGVFDGQGYTVSGLYHNDDSLQTGLFASLYGTARNVGVVNSYLYGDCEVAAISGNARDNAEILNCFSINNVLRICDGGGDAGGIVGYTYGDGAVRNCYAAENYFFDSSWESLSGYDISTKNNYTGVFVFENCYYLAESETDIHEGTAFKTAAQFASGEVAYLLGEAWGQTLDGENTEAYPILGGAKVNYGYTTCDATQSEKIYTNGAVSEEKPDHDYDNGFCTVCDAYQPADLTTDKYDIDGDGESDDVYEIGNAGQLYWFADRVDNDWENFKNVNAVLTANIVVNENVVVDGALNPDADAVASFRVWTAIGNYPDDKFSGIFDGRGHTVSGLYHNDDYYETGLFEDLSGTVRNVGVMNSYLYGDSQVGAIAGRAVENARILNCFSINNCLGLGDGGGEMGGIVGSTWIGTGESTGIIANCWSAYIYAFDYAGPVGGCEISTHHDYPNRLPFENCYYLADSETDIHTGTTYKTAAQFASGEVAYLLGESWGQTLEGENKNAYPVLGGAKVNYGYTTCDAEQSEKIYTNSNVSEEKPGHSGGTATCTAKAICSVCTERYGELAEHNFTEKIENAAHLKAAATCVSGATYWYDCIHCDAISDTLYYTAGKPNEHDFDSNGVCEDCGAHELSYQIVDQSSGSDDVYVQFSAGQKISVFRDGFVIDTVLADGTVIPGEFVEIEWADYYFSGSTDQPMYFYALNKAQFDANEYDYGTQKKQFVVDMHQMTLTSPEGQSPITISPNVWLVLDVHGYNSVTGLGAYAVNVLSAPENSETLWFEVWSTGSGGGQVILQSQATNSFARPSSPILQGITDRTTSNYRRSSSSSDSITYTYKIHTPSANCENISSPTCRTPATCTHCGTVIDPTLDENVHVWSAPCDTTCNEGCGTTRAAGEHTYDDCCDAVCNSEECGFERELTPHVHIGSSVLTNGQYLDETGNVSATKPTGGYAYLSVDTEGALTLTLHDFTYEGNAYYSDVEDHYAVIYSALDLTVKVEGENLLSVNEFEGDSYLISIVVNGNLTVKGDGKATSSLEIGASAELIYRFDALYAYNDLMIENVSVKAIDAEYGIYGESILITNSNLFLATLQDCVFTYRGDIKISNSVLELYSTNSSGIYIGSAEALLIEGSEVYIHAENGIYAPEELSSCTVTNSDLTIDCYDNAILCSALEATDSSISITGMTCDGENDAMIIASNVELEDCTLYIDTNNYLGLEADVASFVSCDIFVYGSYGGLYAGELTLEGCTLVSEGENYGALGADVLRIVGGTLTSDFVLADAYESFTVEEEALLNGIVYVYDPDTQTTTVTVYGEACVGKEQWLDLSYDDINWQAIAGLRVDGWLYLPEGVTGQQIAELGLAGDGMIVCGYGDQAAYYDTSGNPLYHYEYEGDLDFSNVGDGEGQTPAVGNGYSFNADTLTLTLTNFTIRGDLYLPHGNVTVVLNGYVEVYGSIYLAEGEGNALISLEGDGWLWVDEGVEIMHESVLTSEMELSLEIGENVTLHVDDYVTATSLSVYGRLETNYVYIYAMHGGGLRIGEGGVVVATGCLEIALSIGEEPNAADVDPWDYVSIDGGHLSGGIIPVYGDLDGAYGIFFVPEGLETSSYWYGQRAFIQSLPIESHVYDNDCDTTCNACGAQRSITHSHGSTWVTDANEHWNECECGDKANKAAHVDNNGDNKCDTCDYTMPAHDSDTPPVDNPPTDDNDGLGTGAIIGIVVAAVAVVGGGGFALFWFVIRKKRR